MSARRWSVFDIRNRWLRAAASWAIMLCLVLPLAIIGFVLVVPYWALRGARDEVRYGLAYAFDDDTRSALVNARDAMLARPTQPHNGEQGS